MVQLVFRPSLLVLIFLFRWSKLSGINGFLEQNGFHDFPLEREDFHVIYINTGFSMALVKKLKFTLFARNPSYLAVVKL